MNFIKIKKLVDDLASIGIEAVVLELDTETNTTRIRASDSSSSDSTDNKTSLVVYHTIDEDITDGKTIAIEQLRALKSRISIFDDEKTTMSYDVSKRDENVVAMLHFKSGRRNVKMRCDSMVLTGRVPKHFPELSLDGEPITLVESQVNTVLKGISSITITGEKDKHKVTLEHCSEGVKFSAYDGRSDAYDEVFQMEGVADFEKVYMKPYAINTVLKKAISESKEDIPKDSEEDAVVCFFVSNDLPVFALKSFDVAIIPLAE